MVELFASSLPNDQMQAIGVLVAIASFIATVVIGIFTLIKQAKSSNSIQTHGNANVIVTGESATTNVSYHGVDTSGIGIETIRRLEVDLDLSQKTVKTLIDEVTSKNVEIKRRTKRFVQLAQRYRRLRQIVESYDEGSKLARRAKLELERGNFVEVEKLLRDAFLKDQKILSTYQARIELHQQGIELIQSFQSDGISEPSENMSYPSSAKRNAIVDTRLVPKHIEDGLHNLETLQGASDELGIEWWRVAAMQGQAYLYEVQGDLNKALKQHELSIEAIKVLRVAAPENLKLIRVEGRVLLKYSDVCWKLDRTQEALSMLRDAIIVFEDLVSRMPSNEEFQADIKVAKNRLTHLVNVSTCRDSPAKNHTAHPAPVQD